MTGRCSRCGGTDRCLLSPGYFECTAQVLQGVVPQLGLGERPIYGVCGHRYREGPPADVGAPGCPCGLFAIGYCVVCGVPRCGEHGVTAGSRFLCPSHLQKEKADRKAKAVAELASAAGAIRDWLASFPEPEERLLVACLHFGDERKKTGFHDYNPPQVIWTATEILQDAFPELDGNTVWRFFSGGTKEHDPTPGPQERLARWFRDRMLASGQQPDSHYTYRHERNTWWSGARREVTGRTVPGWRLHGAFILSEPDEQHVLTQSLTVWDYRHMARLLDLEPPPPAFLSEWRTAAHRIYDLHDGPPTVGLISNALRETTLPPASSISEDSQTEGAAPVAPSDAVPPPSRRDPPKLTAEQRIEVALRELKSLRIPPSRRLVPGRYYLFPAAKFLGQVGEDLNVEVEPAWAVGSCTWSQPGPHGTDRYEELLTGVTPSGRIVPMTRATTGDNVEMLYARWKRGTDNSSGLSQGTTLYPESIATALERIIAKAR